MVTRCPRQTDTVLEADGELVALATPASVADLRGSGSEIGRRRLVAALIGSLGIAVPVRIVTPARFIGGDHLHLVSTVTAALERADSLKGGDLVCDGAAALVDTVHGWMWSGSYTPAVGNALTEAAGDLGAWVGWTAFDAARSPMAQRYLQETFLLARLNDDRALEVRVLSYMCLLAQQGKRPREEIKLAEAALRAAAGWAPPRLTALLHLRAATDRAGDHDQAGFRRDLTRAENEFSRGASDDDPLWISFLTAAELTGLKGLSLMALGDPGHAAPCFRAASGDLSEARFSRNACYYQARLAGAYLQAGDRDAAEVAALSAVESVAAISSSRTRSLLAPLRAGLPAGEFADRYDEALAQPE